MNASWMAAAAGVAFLLMGDAASAQHGYGQDRTPSSAKGHIEWGAYGVDPVPASRYHSGHYVLAYGVDVVPSMPVEDDLRQIVPGQVEEVLTARQRPVASPPQFVPRFRRRWRMR